MAPLSPRLPRNVVYNNIPDCLALTTIDRETLSVPGAPLHTATAKGQRIEESIVVDNYGGGGGLGGTGQRRYSYRSHIGHRRSLLLTSSSHSTFIRRERGGEGGEFRTGLERRSMKTARWLTRAEWRVFRERGKGRGVEESEKWRFVGDENLRATVGKTVDRTRGVYRNGQGFGWARIGS